MRKRVERKPVPEGWVYVRVPVEFRLMADGRWWAFHATYPGGIGTSKDEARRALEDNIARGAR